MAKKPEVMRKEYENILQILFDFIAKEVGKEARESFFRELARRYPEYMEWS